MKQITTLLLLTLFFSICLSAQNAPDENEGLNYTTRDYDQISLKLDITPDFKQGKLTGKEEFTFIPLTENFTLLRLHSKYTEVSSVLDKDGKKLKFLSTGKLLKISFPGVLSGKEPQKITINFVSSPGRGMYFFAPNAEHPYLPYQLWSQGESDYNRCWYPAYDLPDDKLILSLNCTVPKGFIVVSNGDLTEKKEINNDQTTYCFAMQYPHSNYLTTLIAGNFREFTENFKDTKLYTLFPHDWQGDPYDIVGRTSSMLGFYSSYCLPYPFSSYTQTFVQDFEYGGMENTTATTLNRRVLHNKITAPQYSADELVSHEFAHQWFGDIVTCREWKDIWLNEGFATYMTPLWKLFYYSDDEYFNEIISHQWGVLAKQNNVFTVNDTTTNPGDLDGGFAYIKGSSILHSMREIAGDELFKKIVRKYLSEFAFKSVSSPDFLKVAERESGISFTTLFKQFVYGKGYPEFEIKTSGDLKSGNFTLAVSQKQKGDVFTGKIPVLIGSKEKQVEWITINGRENTFQFKFNTPVHYIRFNHRSTILCKVKYSRPIPELEHQFKDCSDLSAIHDVLVTLEADSVRELSLYESFYKTTQSGRVREYILEFMMRNKLYSTELLGLALASNSPEIREKGARYLSTFSAQFARKTALQLLTAEKNEYIQAALYKIFALNYTKDDSLLLLNALSKNSHLNCIRRAVFEGLTASRNASFLLNAKDLLEYTNSYGDNHLLDFSILDYAESVRGKDSTLASEIFVKGLENFYFRTRVAGASLVTKYLGAEGKKKIKEVLKKEKREVVIKQLENYLKTGEGLPEEE